MELKKVNTLLFTDNTVMIRQLIVVFRDLPLC